ncbi:MAG: hypothetical protein E6J90_46570 [Deltaproteobacteria bacterium]|nr:MAG: hypothetical protein E6J90_46570 [Deltaproteobacteria bacterium]
MSRNQLTQAAVKNVDGNPMFTVDSNGNLQPTGTQTVTRGGSLLIQASSTSASQYTGYVCAWQTGCRCSTLIADLRGESHMKISATPYTISSTAPVDSSYTIYATSSESGGGGPSAMASVGDIRVGGGG